jgi:peptidoglycan/LPS O-acetylase OafA/YrhL
MKTIPSSVAHGTPAASRAVFPDGLRGLAALWVVLFHLSEGNHINVLKMHLPNWVVLAVFDAGHLGVSIFFVLSGFVMALTSASARFDAGVAARFVVRRMVRLTPPYYAAIALGVAMIAFKSSYVDASAPAPGIGIGDIVAHCLYLQTALGVPVINNVFWTLCVEVQFYIAFALIVMLADRIELNYAAPQARVVVFGLLSCVALAWPTGLLTTVFWTGGFIGLFYSFLAGVIVQLGLRFGGYARQIAWTYVGMLFFAALYSHSSFTAFAAVTGAALLLAGHSSGMTRWLSGGWLQFLGMISYSLYLLHNSITGAVFRVFTHFGTETLLWNLVGVAVALAACITCAWMAYRLIEKPAIAWSHAIKLKPTIVIRH